MSDLCTDCIYAMAKSCGPGKPVYCMKTSAWIPGGDIYMCRYRQTEKVDE